MLVGSCCGQAPEKWLCNGFGTNSSSTERTAGTFGAHKVESLVRAVTDCANHHVGCPRVQRNMLSSTTPNFRMSGDIKHVHHLGPWSQWQRSTREGLWQNAAAATMK